MSKNSWESLSAKESLSLIRLYDTPEYSALKKLLEAERLNIAKLLSQLGGDSAEKLAMDMKYLQGQIFALKQIHLIIRDQYKLSQQKEVKAQKKAAAQSELTNLRSTPIAKKAKKILGAS